MFVGLYNWVLPTFTMLGFLSSSSNFTGKTFLSHHRPTFEPPAGPGMGSLQMETTKAPIIQDSEPNQVEKRTVLAKVVGCIAFVFLAVTGIVGNSMVIFAIFTDAAVQTESHVANLAILQLAFTDLMTTSLVCIPGAVVILFDEYTFGIIFCLGWASFNLLGFITTMGLLSVISIDRFIAVRWSLHYPQWVTYNRMFAACAYTWTSTSVCVVGWWFTKFGFDFWAGVCDISWSLLGPDSGNSFIYALCCTIWYFVIPSAIILVCNLLIINMSKEKGRVGKVQDKSGGGVESNKAAKQESKTNSKVLKAMVIVIASYFILTFPSGLVKVMKVLGGPNGPAKYIPGWLTTITSLLQLSASIVNPLIYGLFRKDFRDAFGRIWKRLNK